MDRQKDKINPKEDTMNKETTKETKPQAPKETKPMAISPERRKSYQQTDYKTVGKGKVINNGDVVANALAPLAVEGDAAIQKVAEDNGLGAKFASYAHLNTGQRRMNVGNLLRGIVSKGGTVVIGGAKINDPEAAKRHQAKQAEAQAKKDAAAKVKADKAAEKAASKPAKVPAKTSK